MVVGENGIIDAVAVNYIPNIMHIKDLIYVSNNKGSVVNSFEFKNLKLIFSKAINHPSHHVHISNIVKSDEYLCLFDSKDAIYTHDDSQKCSLVSMKCSRDYGFIELQ